MFKAVPRERVVGWTVASTEAWSAGLEEISGGFKLVFRDLLKSGKHETERPL